MKNKVFSYMGFAKKSGNLVSGVNTCTVYLQKRKVKLMVLAEDISAGSEKKIMKEIRKADAACIKYGTIEELSHATGAQGRSVFAIIDDNFAKAISAEIKS